MYVHFLYIVKIHKCKINKSYTKTMEIVFMFYKKLSFILILTHIFLSNTLDRFIIYHIIIIFYKN